VDVAAAEIMRMHSECQEQRMLERDETECFLNKKKLYKKSSYYEVLTMACGCGGRKGRRQSLRSTGATTRRVQRQINNNSQSTQVAAQKVQSLSITNRQGLTRDRREIERKRRLAIAKRLGK